MTRTEMPGLVHRLVALVLTPFFVGMIGASWHQASTGRIDVNIFGLVTLLVALPLLLPCLFRGLPLVILTRTRPVRGIPSAIIGALMLALPAIWLMVWSNPIEGLRDGWYEILSTHHPRGTLPWFLEISSAAAEMIILGLLSGAIYWTLSGQVWSMASRDR